MKDIFCYLYCIFETGYPTGLTLAKDGTDAGLMWGQALDFLGTQPRRHHSVQDQTGRKASRAYTSEGPEVTWPPSRQPDSQVKFGAGGAPAKGARRQEIRTITGAGPPVRSPGSRPTRKAALSGNKEGHPDRLQAMMLRQGGEPGAKWGHDGGEDIADKLPKWSEPHQGVQRPPTQRHGSDFPSRRRKSFPGQETPKQEHL